MIVEFDTLFLWNMYICRTTEDLEMLEIRLLLIPCLVRRLVVESPRWTSILEINNCSHNLWPEFLRKLTVFDDSLCPLHDRAISTFSNTILIRMIWRSEFVLDSLLFEKLVDILLVLGVIVCTKSLDFGI